MSKLLYWVTFFSAAVSLWVSFVYGPYDPHFKKVYIYPAPFVAVFLFGVVSLVTILLRVNRLVTCTEASKELQEDIAEAKRELGKLGMKL